MTTPVESEVARALTNLSGAGHGKRRVVHLWVNEDLDVRTPPDAPLLTMQLSGKNLVEVGHTNFHDLLADDEARLTDLLADAGFSVEALSMPALGRTVLLYRRRLKFSAPEDCATVAGFAGELLRTAFGCADNASVRVDVVSADGDDREAMEPTGTGAPRGRPRPDGAAEDARRQRGTNRGIVVLVAIVILGAVAAVSWNAANDNGGSGGSDSTPASRVTDPPPAPPAMPPSPSSSSSSTGGNYGRASHLLMTQWKNEVPEVLYAEVATYRTVEGDDEVEGRVRLQLKAADDSGWGFMERVPCTSEMDGIVVMLEDGYGNLVNMEVFPSDYSGQRCNGDDRAYHLIVEAGYGIRWEFTEA